MIALGHVPIEDIDFGDAVESPLRGLTMRELAVYEFPPRRAILTREGMPVLHAGDIAQAHGERGHGKTWLITTLGIVAATGTSALGFCAPEPVRVLIIDGEMASRELQDRASVLAKSMNVLPTDNLTIVAADWQDGFMPRLDTPTGQAYVRPFVERADFILIDNRSTLFDPESEKDPTAWQAAQDWLLSLRRRGKAVLLAHHSNRQGGARGHSKPEDVMNLLLKITRPEDYRADQGVRFKAEFDKSRGAYGAAVAPFTASLTGNGWELEDGHDASHSTAHKLREYLRVAAAAGEPPKSANAAIRAAGVNRNRGLEVWAEMRERRQIVEGEQGGYELAE